MSVGCWVMVKVGFRVKVKVGVRSRLGSRSVSGW